MQLEFGNIHGGRKCHEVSTNWKGSPTCFDIVPGGVLHQKFPFSMKETCPFMAFKHIYIIIYIYNIMIPAIENYWNDGPVWGSFWALWQCAHLVHRCPN
jgi:hypothetical protein